MSWILFISLNKILNCSFCLPLIKFIQKFIILFSINVVTLCLSTSPYTIQFAVLLFSFGKLFKNVWNLFENPIFHYHNIIVKLALQAGQTVHTVCL